MTQANPTGLRPELIGTSELSDAYHRLLAKANLSSDARTLAYLEAFFFLGAETILRLVDLAQDIAEAQGGADVKQCAEIFGTLHDCIVQELNDRQTEQLTQILSVLIRKAQP